MTGARTLYARRFAWKVWVAAGCVVVFWAARYPGPQAALGWLMLLALGPGTANFVRLLWRLATWSRAPWRPPWRFPWWKCGSNWWGFAALAISTVAGAARGGLGPELGLRNELWSVPAELMMLVLTAREVRDELERARVRPPPLPLHVRPSV